MSCLFRLRVDVSRSKLGSVDFKTPDDDAYSRITNPERYQPVVDAARALIDQLDAVYDVSRTENADSIDLIPSVGVPLTFEFTDFPGVIVTVAGNGRLQAFPDCGCDACGDAPPEVIQELDRLVDAAVSGGYREELTKRSLRTWYSGPWGSRSQGQALRRGKWRDLGDLGGAPVATMAAPGGTGVELTSADRAPWSPCRRW